MEEKKMSMSKNIARLAVTAGLTAALTSVASWPR